MQGAEVLIPVTFIAGGFAMIFGIVYLKTRENLAMVEKGMNPKEYANRPAPYRNLKWGLLLLGSGLGLLAAYFLDAYVVPNKHDNEALWFALIGIGGGLGLISSYRIEKKELLDRQDRI
ncbi:MAG TPA: DUF6249 domain-containing protein [Chitinophagaceae bacterium]|nr:DUF6249 domain-containing protein [Chitinophagaceae bacterium]